MAVAVCRECGMHWIWKASYGTHLADLKCSDCGGKLRARKTNRRDQSQSEPHHYSWPLGTTPEKRIEQMARYKFGGNNEHKALCEIEITKAEKAIAKAKGQ